MGISTKRFLIAALSLILLFAISCGDKPTDSGNEKKSSPYAGVWEGGGEKITINPDGSFNINGKDIPANSITQNGNTFSFDVDGAEYSLTFKSDTEVEFNKDGTQIPLTKKLESGGGSSSGNDIDNQIDALLNSFPKPTGNPVSDSSLNGNYNSQNKLTIIPEETKLINYNQSKEDFNKENAEKEISLEININNGMVTCKSVSSSTETLINSKQLYDENKKYSAFEEKYYPGDGVNNTSLYYIEFDINTLTFKFTELIRISGTYNYAYQATYTGTLIKDTGGN